MLKIFRFFKKPQKVEFQFATLSHQVHLSELDKLCNQLAIELARPKLSPFLKVDEEKVKFLEEKLAVLRRSSKSQRVRFVSPGTT